MRKLFQATKGESGLSILEISLYSALLLGALAVSSQAINSSGLARKKMKQYLGYGQFSSYVLSVISNQNNCGVGFGILTPNYSTGNADKNSNSVRLTPGSKTQVSIFSPIGEEYKAGVSIGALTISDLSITVQSNTQVPYYGPLDDKKLTSLGNRSSGAIPGSTDEVYTATLTLAATKSGHSTISNPPISLPLTVRLNASNEMISCSSYRSPNQDLLTSPPCDQYSVASIVEGGVSVQCKRLLCPTGTLPVDYDSNGQVNCSSVTASCNGAGQGLVNVKGQYLCKQLACADPSAPLPWPVNPTSGGTPDPDGFSGGCTNLSSILIDCESDQQSHCHVLRDPNLDPGAYTGYFCPTSSPGNQNKICKEDCTKKSSIDAVPNTCRLVVPPSGFVQHTATQCLNLKNQGITSRLSNDPEPGAAAGRVVCAISDTSSKGQGGCPSGWNFIGKKYDPNPGKCSDKITSFSLDWNGLGHCWPNCAGQADSFPNEFRDSSGAACRTWLMSKNYYAENSDGTISSPPQGTYPNGFKNASFLSGAGAASGIDTSTFSCYTGIHCRLCGKPLSETFHAIHVIADYAFGIDTLLKENHAEVVPGSGGTLYSMEDSVHCPQPNVSYVFNRCDLNCYVGGSLSSCHMTAEYQTEKVKFNVTTYCN